MSKKTELYIEQADYVRMNDVNKTCGRLYFTMAHNCNAALSILCSYIDVLICVQHFYKYIYTQERKRKKRKTSFYVYIYVAM